MSAAANEWNQQRHQPVSGAGAPSSQNQQRPVSGAEAPSPTHLDMAAARERFEGSTDFTVALEEEFALVDPETLELEHRFEELHAACQEDEVLAESAVGELICSEIEIRSGRSESFAEAMERQRDRRARLFAAAHELGIELAATGTHPWASYLDQRIIDTPHYQRLREELRWVAQRNNTWSLHVHLGVRGADRAVAVCDHLRGLLPELLALSANSPFLDGQATGLHTVRTEIFTRTFPRCGVHEPFGAWAPYADFIDLLVRTRSIVEATQIWWSVRPHHAFGTVELRICDAQARGSESFALAGLIAACIAQAALDYDDGRLPEPMRQREIEENLWRAIRYGMDGEMIDFARRSEVPARAAVERVVEWTAPARKALGIDIAIPDANGAQRAYRALAGGASIEEIYRESVAETQRTYVPEGVSTA
jgi:carboxylate-amine ligase